MPDVENLTIRDVAALLKVVEKTRYTMAQAGDLPGFSARGQARFRRSEIAAQVELAKARPDARGGDE